MAVFELEAVLSLSSKAFDDGLKSSGQSMKSFGQRLGKAVGTVAKITAAAITASATAVGAIVKQSIEAYGEFEQLVGGSQLMYGDAFDYVMDRAQNAYKNVQLSQSDYLKQVNGIATGLKNAMGGNAQAAAELADRVVTAEADIVAATGVSQEAVQNAFNGIMRGNFTMLDNLQLGIAGTRQGIESVITQVNAWNRANGRATKYSLKNTADIMRALVDYVEMQGLAGYAANEASTTIQGSIAQMKAAYQNLLIGLADPEANLEELFTNLIDSISTVSDNIMPHVSTILDGIGSLISSASETLIPQIASFLGDNAGDMAVAGAKLFGEIVSGLINSADDIVDRLPEMIDAIKGAFTEENLKSLKDAGLKLASMIWEGLKEGLQWIGDLMHPEIQKLAEGADPIEYPVVGVFQGFRGVPGGGGSSAGGFGHAIGLDYVPRNDYAALLHRGEAVLTRDEAETWRRGQSGGRNVTINQYMQEVVRTPVEHAAATLSYFEQARWAM